LKIAFLTLGCKVNQYETDKLKEQAELAGFDVVSFDDMADIYCINSCSVTNMSQRKSRQMISHARKLNNSAIIALLGCAVESAKDDLNSLNADILIGNNDKEKFIQILLDVKSKKEKTIVLTDISKQKEYNEKGLLTKAYDVREAVKIEDGCNNFCSYCIIPYLRGRVRSRVYDDIENEVKGLISNGVKEIVLVGIEVASYGKDLENISLIDVIERINKLEGLERLRLSSLEPRYLTLDIIKRLANCKTICNHFHISMQSGSTETLKRMNRKYNKKLLIEVCQNLREYFPEAYIAADVIVGFPGESEEEFLETQKTIECMSVNELHVFKYSQRAYTRAAKFENQVDGNIKKKRSDELIKYSKVVKKRYLQKYINSTVKVLFESWDNGILQGYTTNYIRVKSKGDKSLCGTIQDVVVTSLELETMIGEIIQKVKL